MRHKLAFTAPLLFMGALLVHCGTGSFSTVGDGSDASVRNPSCPSTPPTPGAACGLADGTTCSNYPSAAAGCACCSGASPSYECTGGTWVAFATGAGGGVPNVTAACPVTVPKQGDSCVAPCGGAQFSCSFDCAHGNGSVSTANCQNGSWQVLQSDIACEPDDGGTDAAGDAHD
jgi:hypothetical protein